MRKKNIWNTFLGNFFEHYDTALFGLLSPFLAPLIFPDQEPLIALIRTYAIIPLGMIARPLGSLIFGYIGDVHGRHRALFATLLGMGILSCMISCLPLYAQIGAIAPAFFLIARLLQNFLAGGEIMGGGIFLLENAPEKQHNLLSGFYGSSTVGGYLLASFGVYLLSLYGILDSGWRLLYLFGGVTAVFGSLIRKNTHYGISAVPAQKNFSRWAQNLWKYRKEVLLIALVSGFNYANYSIALLLMNGLVPLISSVTKTEVMAINSSLLVLDFCTLPLFGWLASKLSKETLMLSAGLAIAFCALPLFSLLDGANFATIVGVRVCFVLLGVAFCAPFHAWTQQLVPSEARYAVISCGYALGSQLIGGPTAAFSLWCFQRTGIVASAGWYWIALALVCCLGIFLFREPAIRTQPQEN